MSNGVSGVDLTVDRKLSFDLASDDFNHDKVAQIVRDVVVNVLNLEIRPSEISDDANLFDLGADSMSIVDLFFQLEERFALKFEETQLSVEMFQRFGDLASFVYLQIGAKAQ